MFLASIYLRILITNFVDVHLLRGFDGGFFNLLECLLPLIMLAVVLMKETAYRPPVPSVGDEGPLEVTFCCY